MLMISLIGISCSSISTNIFAKRTPHESYAKKLEDSGLKDTPLGIQWFTSATSSLQQPHTVDLPYKHTGYFQTDRSRALGIRIKAIRGEKLTFRLNRKATDNFVVFADLYKEDQLENKPRHLLSVDTTETVFTLEVTETGNYILRLQPELYRTGEYSLAISSGPSILFPVAGKKSNIGSFWGAARDGGIRKHEGIDIFAKKRTPVVAASDGVITRVRNGGIGGKTVWLRSIDKNVSFYYAHLDEQLVSAGQFVKEGDTLGLVGNTGNARTTPPHLHFGIYTYGGAIDPLPFVKKLKEPSDVPEKTIAGKHLKLKKAISYETKKISANTLLIPLAVTSKGFIAELPDGKLILTSHASVQIIKAPKQVIKEEIPANTVKQS